MTEQARCHEGKGYEATLSAVPKTVQKNVFALGSSSNRYMILISQLIHVHVNFRVGFRRESETPVREKERERERAR